MADMKKLRDVGVEVSYHLDQIMKCFKDGAKVTLLVRQPSQPDGSQDFMMGDDDLGEAIRAIELRRVDPKGIVVEPDVPVGG